MTLQELLAQIPPYEEIDRVRESRPTEAELALAVAHAMPWNNPVAYTLKLEIEFLQMHVKLLKLEQRNTLQLVGLLTGVDAGKTIAALQAWARAEALTKDLSRVYRDPDTGRDFVYLDDLKQALEGK